MRDALHFTVASTAGHNSPGQLDLAEDLDLVKASLLYADKVRLCSVGSSFLSAIAQYAEAPEKERAKLVVRYLPVLQPSMGADEIHFMEAAVGMRSRREERSISKRTRKEILGMVREEGEELRAAVLHQHRAAGIEGFRAAVREGLLEVHTFRQTSVEALIEAQLRGNGDWLRGVDIADVLVEYLDLASEAVMDGTTYPLLDAPTAEFVAAVEGAGFAEIPVPAADRGRYSGLARDLLRRLPLFEMATIDEVLDIRRDLRMPLLGFRQAVGGFAREVRTAAWQVGFADEA
jgi:hypothetical protein